MKPSSFLKGALSLLLLCGIFFFVSPQALLAEFFSISLIHVGLLLLISVAMVWLSAAKWRLFLGEDAPSTWRLFNLYLIGYFVNALLPSYVGGDAARSYLAGKKSGQVTAASATILERYTGLVAMFGLGLLASLLPLGVAVPVAVRIAVVLLAMGLALVTAMLLWRKSFDFGTKLLPQKFRDTAGKIRISLIAGVTNRRVLAEALLLSLVYHCFTVINTAVAAYAVGWGTVPLAQLFVVLPIILTIGGLPITPSGLGLQEGAFVYFLGILGASGPQSLAIGILLRAKSYILAFVGWGLFVLEQRSVSATSEQPDSGEATESIRSCTVTGTGRAKLVVITEQSASSELAGVISSEYTCTELALNASFGADVWRTIDNVESALEKSSVRSAVFVGVGDAACVVQALTLRAPKLVRTMVLVDATSRPHPSKWVRLIDWLEKYLPLGLPFRNDTDGFDALSLSHRLRSPCVVAVSGSATEYQRSEARVLSARLPTAVLLESGKSIADTICEAVQVSKEMPARCPQEGRTQTVANAKL